MGVFGLPDLGGWRTPLRHELSLPEASSKGEALPREQCHGTAESAIHRAFPSLRFRGVAIGATRKMGTLVTFLAGVALGLLFLG